MSATTPREEEEQGIGQSSLRELRAQVRPPHAAAAVVTTWLLRRLQACLSSQAERRGSPPRPFDTPRTQSEVAGGAHALPRRRRASGQQCRWRRLHWPVACQKGGGQGDGWVEDWDTGAGGRAEDDWGGGAGGESRSEEDDAAYRAFMRRRAAVRRRRETQPPRDEFLRPMIDGKGVQYRLGFKASEYEQELRQEMEENQYESRVAVKFAGLIVAVPLVVGFAAAHLLGDPFLEVAQHFNANVLALSSKQKVEGAQHVRDHQLQLRMEAAIGMAPPIESQAELIAELRHCAKEVEAELIHHNRESVLHRLSDGAAVVTGVALVATRPEGRGALVRTVGRVLSGLSDVAKAFLVIGGTDVLLGYHSAEGWTAAIRLLTRHYGYEVEETPIGIFVAIVPVALDAYFKLWIFRGLTKSDPAAAVTLRSMDRH